MAIAEKKLKLAWQERVQASVELKLGAAEQVMVVASEKQELSQA